MAKTICPRCAVPLRRADVCGRCGPVVSQLLDGAPVAVTAAWPEARRRLDDLPPPARRRRHAAAAACVAAAAVLVLLALL